MLLLAWSVERAEAGRGGLRTRRGSPRTALQRARRRLGPEADFALLKAGLPAPWRGSRLGTANPLGRLTRYAGMLGDDASRYAALAAVQRAKADVARVRGAREREAEQSGRSERTALAAAALTRHAEGLRLAAAWGVVAGGAGVATREQRRSAEGALRRARREARRVEPWSTEAQLARHLGRQALAALDQLAVELSWMPPACRPFARKALPPPLRYGLRRVLRAGEGFGRVMRAMKAGDGGR